MAKLIDITGLTHFWEKVKAFITETLKSYATKTELNTKMANTPSGHPMHDVYKAMGAIWYGTMWGFNGLDLTSEDLALVSLFSPGDTYRDFGYAFTKAKTNYTLDTENEYGLQREGYSINYVFFYNTEVQSIKANYYPTSAIAAFCGCRNLQKIKGVFDVGLLNGDIFMFKGCLYLHEVNISNLHFDLNLGDVWQLYEEYYIYMIKNEAATEPITIIVHRLDYEDVINNARIQDALRAHPLVTVASA